jgi:hypothetical protein
MKTYLSLASRDDLYAGLVLSSPSSSSSSSHIQLTSLTGNDVIGHDGNLTSGLLSLDCVSMSQHSHHPDLHSHLPPTSMNSHLNNNSNFSIHEIDPNEGVSENHGDPHSPKYISL